jgi:hypothetical protein
MPAKSTVSHGVEIRRAEFTYQRPRSTHEARPWFDDAASLAGWTLRAEVNPEISFVVIMMDTPSTDDFQDRPGANPPWMASGDASPS